MGWESARIRNSHFLGVFVQFTAIGHRQDADGYGRKETTATERECQNRLIIGIDLGLS